MTYISEALRHLVIERAQQCCEYCLLSDEDSFLPFEIDHIIAEKHGGATEENNLCYSCPNCNGFKGSDISSRDPRTKNLTALFNPREQKWKEHFELKEAVIEALTPEGRVTVFLLKMNRPEIVEERANLILLNRYPCRLITNT